MPTSIPSGYMKHLWVSSITFIQLHLGSLCYITKQASAWQIVFKMHVFLKKACVSLSIMISPEYWESYHEQLGALDLACHPTSFIPRDWALNVADIASEWVEQQFAAHIAGRPLVPAPPELDPETMVACGQLASVLAEAYQHPGKVEPYMFGVGPLKCL